MKSYAQIAYEAYGNSVEWTAVTGVPMLQWEDQSEKIKNAWSVAANVVIEKVNSEHTESEISS